METLEMLFIVLNIYIAAVLVVGFAYSGTGRLNEVVNCLPWAKLPKVGGDGFIAMCYLGLMGLAWTSPTMGLLVLAFLILFYMSGILIVAARNELALSK